MAVTYNEETELYQTDVDQPPTTETCTIRDVIMRGISVLQNYGVKKEEYNDWVSWVGEVDEANPVGYVPTALSGTYTEELLVGLGWALSFLEE